MDTTDDLLVRLFGWAHRQSENFTTEAFVHVLDHLSDTNPVHAARLLTWLTGARVEFSPADLLELAIQTQFSTEDHGRPDVRVIGQDIDVIVEVKLDGSLTAGQVGAYRRALDASPKPRRALIGLTGKPPAMDLGGDVVLRLWRDVGSELQAILRQLDSAEPPDPITEREIRQFLRLLDELRLSPAPRVDSPLGEAVAKHRKRMESAVPERTLFNTRVRRLDLLDAWPELAPLRALLIQVRDALADLGHRARLESGQAGQWPWVGYTVDNLAYFVEVNLGAPRGLTFTRYAGGVAPDSYDKTLGRLAVQQRMHRWCNDLDLTERGYFTAGAHDQVAIVRAFLSDSFAYSAKLRPIKQDGA